mgnify:CR=1 FL=1
MKEKSRVLSKLMGLAVVACVMAMLFGMTTFAANKYTNMAAKKVYTNFDQDNSITHYYKINVKSSGLLRFSGFGQYSTAYDTYSRGLTVKLCNSRGKELDSAYVNADSSYEYSREVSYGVNKGTYMLKVQTSDAFALTYDFKAFKEKSGTSLKKAVSLKKKKIKYGVVGIGESGKKVDYYKITLKKPAKIYLDIQGLSSGSISVKVTPAKGIRLSGSAYTSVYNNSRTMKLQTTSGGKLPKGTYYIRVYRASKNPKVSGVYALKWKK